MEEENTESTENIEDKKGEFNITLKKDQVWKYSTFVLGAIIVIAAFVFFIGGEDNPSPANGVVNPPSGVPAKVSASVDDDAVLGDPDAPVTIIEFSDYECPFCSRFWSQTLPQLKEEYIDTGKVKLVYRDFPLTSIHPMAQPAAEAAECVREQGGDEAYFEMHDKIYGNQQSLSDANLKKWASELGYDIDECLDSGEFTSEVQADSRDAQAAGGRGTPFFVINDVPLSGAQPFSNFQQVIEAELAA
tara:strand:- start:4909 stop:5646 length:738 start_codon:yes stop_codon:yes gene_type:complete